MKASQATMKEMLSLSAVEHYILVAIEKKFEGALFVQGQQQDGSRQLWVYKKYRWMGDIKTKMRSFENWINRSTEYTAIQNHEFGLILKKDPNKPVRLLVPKVFIQWREKMKAEIEANKKFKKQVFKPKTPIGYKLGGKELIVSQWGTIYVPHPFKRVGKVCGSTKTRTGSPCKRWCNTGHCKGH